MSNQHSGGKDQDQRAIGRPSPGDQASALKPGRQATPVRRAPARTYAATAGAAAARVASRARAVGHRHGHHGHRRGMMACSADSLAYVPPGPGEPGRFHSVPGHGIPVLLGPGRHPVRVPGRAWAPLTSKLLSLLTSTTPEGVLDPLDRGAAALRKFIELSRALTSMLGISEDAAAERYFRALKRLNGGSGDDAGRPQGPGSMAIDDSKDYDLLDRLAEEFAERLRRGERPTLRSTPTGTRSWPTRSASCSRRWWRSSGSRRSAPTGTRRRPRHRRRSRRCRRWATTGSSARSAAAAWGSSTRPSRSRSAGAWP